MIFAPSQGRRISVSKRRVYLLEDFPVTQWRFLFNSSLVYIPPQKAVLLENNPDLQLAKILQDDKMLGTLDEIVERAIYGFGVAICTSGSNEPFSLGDVYILVLPTWYKPFELECNSEGSLVGMLGHSRILISSSLNGSVNRYSSERAYGRSGARYHVKHKGTFTLGYLYSGCLARGPGKPNNDYRTGF